MFYQTIDLKHLLVLHYQIKQLPDLLVLQTAPAPLLDRLFKVALDLPALIFQDPLRIRSRHIGSLPVDRYCIPFLFKIIVRLLDSQSTDLQVFRKSPDRGEYVVFSQISGSDLRSFTQLITVL